MDMKTLAKRLIALGLVLTMMTSCISIAIAEDDENKSVFTPTFLNAMDMTVSKWYGTTDNRELLVAMAMIDANTSVSDEKITDALIDALVKDTVYVGKTDTVILEIFFFAKDSIITLTYTPILKESECLYFDSDSASTLSSLLMANFASELSIEYEQVDSENVVKLISSILELLED